MYTSTRMYVKFFVYCIFQQCSNFVIVKDVGTHMCEIISQEMSKIHYNQGMNSIFQLQQFM